MEVLKYYGRFCWEEYGVYKNNTFLGHFFKTCAPLEKKPVLIIPAEGVKIYSVGAEGSRGAVEEIFDRLDELGFIFWYKFREPGAVSLTWTLYTTILAPQDIEEELRKLKEEYKYEERAFTVKECDIGRGIAKERCNTYKSTVITGATVWFSDKDCESLLRIEPNNPFLLFAIYEVLARREEVNRECVNKIKKKIKKLLPEFRELLKQIEERL